MDTACGREGSEGSKGLRFDTALDREGCGVAFGAIIIIKTALRRVVGAPSND